MNTWWSLRAVFGFKIPAVRTGVNSKPGAAHTLCTEDSIKRDYHGKFVLVGRPNPPNQMFVFHPELKLFRAQVSPVMLRKLNQTSIKPHLDTFSCQFRSFSNCLPIILREDMMWKEIQLVFGWQRWQQRFVRVSSLVVTPPTIWTTPVRVAFHLTMRLLLRAALAVKSRLYEGKKGQISVRKVAGYP